MSQAGNREGGPNHRLSQRKGGRPLLGYTRASTRARARAGTGSADGGRRRSGGGGPTSAAPLPLSNGQHVSPALGGRHSQRVPLAHDGGSSPGRRWRHREGSGESKGDESTETRADVRRASPPCNPLASVYDPSYSARS